ncbi:MAG: DNA/RNA nuclease SfsA [Thermodesulfobacteriota bacterium]
MEAIQHGARTLNTDPSLPWPELIPGTLIKRYKRFLADIRLDTGENIVAHCPNSGRMTGCSLPGRPVYISRQDSPKRKLKFTWEMIQMPDSLVGINTQVPNRLVYHAAKAGAIDALTGYETVKREVRAGEHTRLDLMLRRNCGEVCYVEIKNSTLVENRTAFFPDAVTNRGKNHLVELQKLVGAGNRCVMFFLVQRMDADRFMPADHIDPAYGKELRSAVNNGVEILVYDVHMDLETIRLRNRLPWRLS